MNGLELIIWLMIVAIALLGGAVAYLFNSRRNYQRIDYGHHIQQDEQIKQLNKRLEYVEQLISDLVKFDRVKRVELENYVSVVKSELANQLKSARQDVVGEVLNNPVVFDELLYETVDDSYPSRVVDHIRRNEDMLKDDQKLKASSDSERKKQIAELLELGHSSQEVSKLLGVSCHEVELVGSMIFKSRTA